jgi:hypothetical protein
LPSAGISAITNGRSHGAWTCWPVVNGGRRTWTVRAGSGHVSSLIWSRPRERMGRARRGATRARLRS